MSSSRIFTSEPMVSRALAAEIRNSPEQFFRLLEDKLRNDSNTVALRELIEIRCEDVRAASLDIVLSVRTGEGEEKKIGLESKFDHEIRTEQIERERRAVDYLCVIVRDEIHANSINSHSVGVVTWYEAIACFHSSRLTAIDIESIPISKVSVEALLEREGIPHFVELSSAEWDIRVERGTRGMPSICTFSPPSGGRCLTGQVQVVGWKMPDCWKEVKLEYHIGIEVSDTEGDFPAIDSNLEPKWIPYLKRLEKVVRESKSALLKMSNGRSGGGNFGMNKIPLIDRYLGNGKRWLAKGYVSSAIGIKSEAVVLSNLGELCAEAVRLFSAWYSAEQGISSDSF